MLGQLEHEDGAGCGAASAGGAKTPGVLAGGCTGTFEPPALQLGRSGGKDGAGASPGGGRNGAFGAPCFCVCGLP